MLLSFALPLTPTKSSFKNNFLTFSEQALKRVSAVSKDNAIDVVRNVFPLPLGVTPAVVYGNSKMPTLVIRLACL